MHMAHSWTLSLMIAYRYTMVIGALITMVFFFAYTAVRTANQNLGFACAISFCLNIYYAYVVPGKKSKAC